MILLNDNMTGYLPSSIGDLVTIKLLAIGPQLLIGTKVNRSGLSGTFPSSISKLSQLRTVVFMQASTIMPVVGLSGSLPSLPPDVEELVIVQGVQLLPTTAHFMFLSIAAHHSALYDSVNCCSPQRTL